MDVAANQMYCVIDCIIYVHQARIRMYRTINPIRAKRMDSSERKYAFTSRLPTNWIYMNRPDYSACLTYSYMTMIIVKYVQHVTL